MDTDRQVERLPDGLKWGLASVSRTQCSAKRLRSGALLIRDPGCFYSQRTGVPGLQRTIRFAHAAQRPGNRISSSLPQIVVLQRQRADALAAGREDGVAERWRDHRYRRFAEAALEAAARHQNGLHLR